MRWEYVTQAAQLDNTARRYAWFRRLLKTFDEEKADIFPESWELPRVLAAKFIENTRCAGREKCARTDLLIRL